MAEFEIFIFCFFNPVRQSERGSVAERSSAQGMRKHPLKIALRSDFTEPLPHIHQTKIKSTLLKQSAKNIIL